MSRRAKVNASQMLMPLAFASILASSVTLIGTSTNVVVSGLMTQYGMQPMGMFELSVVGVPVVVVGLAYMFLIGKRLIPVRDAPEELTEEFNLRPFLTEIMILPNSSLIGKTLAESGLGRDLDLTVIRLIRGEDNYLVPQADLRLEAADILLVEGQRDNLLALKNSARIGVEASRMVTDMDLQTEGMRLAEVILITLDRSPAFQPGSPRPVRHPGFGDQPSRGDYPPPDQPGNLENGRCSTSSGSSGKLDLFRKKQYVSYPGHGE
jgi:di/tricarboxylate transporter